MFLVKGYILLYNTNTQALMDYNKIHTVVSVLPFASGKIN